MAQNEATPIKADDHRGRVTEDAGAAPDALVEEERGARPRRASLSSGLMDYISRSPRLIRVWRLMPVASLIVAALCVTIGYVDAAFVVATLGVVAWFVEMRNRLHADVIEPDAPESVIERKNENARNEYS